MFDISEHTNPIPELKVVYTDDYFYVVDKPFGVAVNKSQTTIRQVTVQDLILDNFQKMIESDAFKKAFGQSVDQLTVEQPAKEQYTSEQAPTDQLIEENSDTDSSLLQDNIKDEIVNNDENLGIEAFYSRCGIVHRIDKDTSGLLMIAKDPSTFLKLQKLFAGRQIKKEYKALAYGIFVDIAVGESFEIDAPIARSNKNREKFAIDENGRAACTIFKIDEILVDPGTGEEFTLLTCYPQTGRTHQIRVHLTVLGHPIFGDKLYSGRKRYKTHLVSLDRQFLHATALNFIHPITNKEMTINSEIPCDLKAVLNSLHKR